LGDGGKSSCKMGERARRGYQGEGGVVLGRLNKKKKKKVRETVDVVKVKTDQDDTPSFWKAWDALGGKTRFENRI